MSKKQSNGQFVNKINIFTHDKPSDAFSMYVLFPVGSINESYSMSGCSHVLEHMLFKNMKNITKRMAAIGARYNGFTSLDVTCYYINTISKHHAEAILILHDMLKNAKFTDKELNLEKNVILEEYWQRNSNLKDKNTRTLLHKDNVYNKLPIGRPEVIKNITAHDLIQYHKQHYGRPVIVVFCDLSTRNNVRKLITRLFGGPERYVFMDDRMYQLGSQIDPKVIVMNAPGPGQNVIKISFYTFPGINNIKKHIIMEFIQHCLTGASIYSLLSQKLRGSRGMTYSSYSSNDVFLYAGMFVMIVKSTQNIEHVFSLICKVLETIKKRGLGSVKLLDFFKYNYITYIDSRKGNDEYHLDIATTIFYGSLGNACPIQYRINVIKSLTNHEISQVATEAFAFDKVGILTVGRYPNANTVNNKLQDILQSYES